MVTVRSAPLAPPLVVHGGAPVIGFAQLHPLDSVFTQAFTILAILQHANVRFRIPGCVGG